MAWRVIDAHIHLSENKEDALRAYARLSGLKYTLDELLRIMDQNAVAQGLILTSVTKAGELLPNEDVMELCGRNRGRLSPVLSVAPSYAKVSDAIRLAKRGKIPVKAFKIMLGYGGARASDRVFDRLLDYAESEDLPVMFHTGDTAIASGDLADAHPLTLDALANRRHDLRIVACHFGNPWIDDVAELIYKQPNVYADISGLAASGGKYSVQYARSVAEKLSRAIYFAGGADKIVFGSDYPVMHPARAISLVSELEIDSKDRRRILSDNAKKIFML